MSVEINFGGQSIMAVTFQVEEILKGTTLTRKKVIECCKAIFTAHDCDGVTLGAFAEIVWESVRVAPEDSIDRLPTEVLKTVLKHVPEVGKALVVSPQFNALAKPAMLERAEKALSNAFGAAEWKEFMGAEVRKEPPLPPDILEILAKPCPFTADGRVVADTHLLMLIPGSINGREVTINSLGKLFKAKFPAIGNPTGYQYISPDIQNAALFYRQSQWVLMTRDVIAGSKNKTFLEQVGAVSVKGEGKYSYPYLFEATACILMEYARSKGQTRLYGETLTRCVEIIDGHPVVVGNFAPSGLSVCRYFCNDISTQIDPAVGVAALRTLA